ncbi:MAG: HD domain-containing protein [Rubrivivax sp.]
MQAVVDFVLEIDRLKAVTRQTRPLGLQRPENSAEHSWQIAMLALSLLPHAAEPVDGDRVVRLLLVHDLGEIDTGDALVYDEAAVARAKAGEREAVRRITGLLPPPQAAEWLALWDEFEAGVTAEARFAHAADRAMPALLNLADGGHSWVAHGIGYERVVARIGPPIQAGCPALWAWMKERLDEELVRGWFGMGR